MKKIILIYIVNLIAIGAFGQEKEVVQVQPSIIVVPYTSSGENAFVKYEEQFSYRAAITEISNALNERGFRPENLDESIRSMKEDEAISTLKGVTFDPVQKILNNSSADIVIKAEIYIFTENELNSVQIRLTAVEKSSNNVLYDKNFEASPSFKSKDFGYLAQRCLTNNGQLEQFVNGLNSSFADIIANGKAIKVIIEVGETSTYLLDDEVQSEYISDQILDWCKANAYKNNLHIKTNASKQLYIDELRIPLRNKDKTNYDINSFSKELRIAILDICQKKDGVRPKLPKPIVNAGTIRIVMP